MSLFFYVYQVQSYQTIGDIRKIYLPKGLASCQMTIFSKSIFLTIGDALKRDEGSSSVLKRQHKPTTNGQQKHENILTIY